MNLHLSQNHSPAPSPFSQQFFFSLSLSSSPTQTRSIIIMSHLFACGVWHLSLFFAKWWNVLLFYFSSLTHSAFGEGEIISNYRESRRCRPSSCACSYLLVCGRRMKRVGGGICPLNSRAVRPVSLIFSFHHVLVGRVRTRPVVANWLFGGFRAYLAQFRRHRRRWLTPSVLFVCLLLLDIRSLEPRFESLFFRNGEANRRRKILMNSCIPL